MLNRYAARYEQHLFETIVPFWLKHSPDHEYGGYFTCLDTEGRVYDTRKYVWLNGRQVWMLSRLYNEAGQKPEYLAAARLGAEFLRRHVFDEQGRCWFSLTREGLPAGYQRKPYGAVFTMLGFHEFGRATGEEWYQQKAHELFGKVRKWIEAPKLLGRPTLAGGQPVSQLADIYVVLAMALQLGDRVAVREMLHAMDANWDRVRRLWIENAVTDPERRFEWPDGRLICVGSNFEITWLLLDALEIHPDEAARRRVLDTLESALEFGWDQRHGGLFYFQDIEGKPMLQLEAQMKLWWVHAEAICALTRAYEATGEERWLRWLERVDEYTFARFPDAKHGEWFGYLDREGRVTHQLKGNHYKGCFHIPRALWLSVQAARRTQTG